MIEKKSINFFLIDYIVGCIYLKFPTTTTTTKNQISVDHHHHHRQRWSIGSALTTATLTDYCEDNHYGLATITDDGEKFYRNHHHSCQNQINFDDHQSKSSSSFMTTVEIDTIPNIETIISNCNNIKLQQPNFKCKFFFLLLLFLSTIFFPIVFVLRVHFCFFSLSVCPV